MAGFGVGFTHSDAHADTFTDHGPCNSDPYENAHPDPHRYSTAVRFVDSLAECHPDPDSHSHPYSNPHAHGNPHYYSDSYADSRADTDAHSYAQSDSAAGPCGHQ